MVAVAQLVESQLVELVVTGSSPVGHPKMEKEEEILEKYIRGTQTGEDNKLRAAVGSLDSKRTKELTTSLNALERSINHSVSNLIINIDHNAGNLIRSVGTSMESLGQSIEKQIDNLIESNEKLGRSNEKYTISMKWLTASLVLVGVAQIIATILK